MAFCFSTDYVEKKNDENYKSYLIRLYDIFKNDILNNLYLNGKKVELRESIQEGQEKEEAFYHLTCTDYIGQTKYRYPDFNRSKRLKLIKPIIENVNNCPNCNEQQCNGILLWKKPYKSTYRYHLYLESQKYIVVIEERTSYYLLITAFYVHPSKEEHYLKEYDIYRIDVI